VEYLKNNLLILFVFVLFALIIPFLIILFSVFGAFLKIKFDIVIACLFAVQALMFSLFFVLVTRAVVVSFYNDIWDIYYGMTLDMHIAKEMMEVQREKLGFALFPESFMQVAIVAIREGIPIDPFWVEVYCEAKANVMNDPTRMEAIRNETISRFFDIPDLIASIKVRAELGAWLSSGFAMLGAVMATIATIFHLPKKKTCDRIGN